LSAVRISALKTFGIYICCAIKNIKFIHSRPKFFRKINLIYLENLIKQASLDFSDVFVTHLELNV
jgi:hypothetical protein